MKPSIVLFIIAAVVGAMTMAVTVVGSYHATHWRTGDPLSYAHAQKVLEAAFYGLGTMVITLGVLAVIVRMMGD